MSVRVHVATRYDVDLEEIKTITADRANELIEKIVDEYDEDFISWNNESRDQYEFNRWGLEHLLEPGVLREDDPDASDIKTFMQTLLDKADKTKDYVVLQIL